MEAAGVNPKMALATPGTRGTKPRPAWLRALGRGEPPVVVNAAGRVYRRVAVLKHDAFAATALYECVDEATGESHRLVGKFARTAPAFGVPMGWLGALAHRREARIHAKLADVPGVPKLVSPLLDDSGVPLRRAWGRVFVEGGTLKDSGSVPDGFFTQLETLLREVHARRVAVVDLDKPDNILIGPDGAPHLIDFQISYAAPDGWLGRRGPAVWWLTTMQRCDRYHLLKHRIRRRPDELTDAQRDLDAHRPAWVRFWRRTWRPVLLARRRLLVALGVRRGAGTSETETPAA